MIKNYSKTKTPFISEKWINMSNEPRKLSIVNEIKIDKRFEKFDVVKTPDNGQIELKINDQIASNIRGELLLDFEEIIKKKIDKGLTIWCIPVGDKSKLRNLRGVNIETA